MSEAMAGPAARRLPPEFDRLVVILTVQAHLFNLIYVATRSDIYRVPSLGWVLWTVSLLIPIGGLLVARRSGGELSGRQFAVAAAAMLVVVDGGLTLLTYPAELGSPAVWQWSAVGVSILAFSPLRPPRDILTVAALHAGLAAISLLMGFGQPTVTGYRAAQDIGAALVPAFAAAAYVRMYTRALRLREEAGAEERRARSQEVIASAVRDDSRRRLGDLGGAAGRLLAAVRDGADPRSPDVVAEAKRLSTAVRSELVEARSGAWVLQGRPGSDGENADTTDGPDGEGWPGLILLDPEQLLERLSSNDRAALAAIVEALRGIRGWRRVSVVVIGDDAGRATVAVVATGPLASVALGDAALGAGAAAWGAEMLLEDNEILTVERDVDLLAPVVPSANRLADDVAALVSTSRRAVRTERPVVG